jgi:hypothetical protein
LFVACWTIAALGGAVKDRIYGSRKRYSRGIFAGRMDRSVTKAGMVWYGRNVVMRAAVLNSWILRPGQYCDGI